MKNNRREFLKKSAAVALTVSAGGIDYFHAGYYW